MYGTKTTTQTAKSTVPVSLNGKNIIIIGGTSGIGYSLAKAAKAVGANVTIVGRTLRDDSLTTEFVKADLSLISTAEEVAHNLPFEACDILIFTTGIVPSSKKQTTSEGVELDMVSSSSL